MHKNEKISLYTCNFYQDKFKERLQTILNKENSSIAVCDLAKANSGYFTLFFKPHNFKNSNISFNFHHFFCDKKEKDEDFYAMKKGFSKDDLDDLSDLLDDYVFENHHEGQFFASKFFMNNRKKGSLILNSYVFKFTPSEDFNRHIIGENKFKKYYSIATQETIKRSILEQDNNIYEMKYFNSYSFNKFEDLNKVIKEANDYNSNYKEKFFVIEFYKDVETYASYIKSIYSVSGEIITEQSPCDFLY